MCPPGCAARGNRKKRARDQRGRVASAEVVLGEDEPMLTQGVGFVRRAGQAEAARIVVATARRVLLVRDIFELSERDPARSSLTGGAWQLLTAEDVLIDVRWGDVPSYRVEQVAFAPETTIVRPRGDCVIFPIPSSPGEDLVVMPAELPGWTEVMESAGVRRTASEK